ncbi:putative alpha/beta hydrolase [Tanacetum coccineum]|uniref:Alpha/beta hydrolase n=1 Tax=Tanacetum coccineum TaxID=301880 RepID=A0ABQ5B4U9_9ASTR
MEGFTVFSIYPSRVSKDWEGSTRMRAIQFRCTFASPFKRKTHSLLVIYIFRLSLDLIRRNLRLLTDSGSVDPAQALNVPIVPLGAMLTAVYSLTSRPPYSLAWLNHMISTQDIMDPDLLKKLVLKNFCTIPAKLLLQLASAFKERGLSDRSGTFFYQEHIHKINVPILVVASDQDAICPLKLYKKFDNLNIDDDLQTHCISVTFTGYGSYWNGRWRLKYISFLNRIWLLLEWKTEVEVYQLPYIIWLLLEWKMEVEVYQLPYIIWSTLYRGVSQFELFVQTAYSTLNIILDFK